MLPQRVAFSPDGNTLALTVGSSVQLLDGGTGQPVAQLDGHQGLVRCVAFSQDSKLLASARNDRMIRIWDLATNQAQHELSGHEQEIDALTFSPDGKTLASADRASIRTWDLERMIQHSPVEATTDDRKRLWFLKPDLLLSYVSGEISLWQSPYGIAKGKLLGYLPISTLRGGDPPPRLLQRDSIVLDTRRSVQLYDVKTGQVRATLAPNESAAYEVARDGKVVATSEGDRTIRLWDVASGELLANLQTGDRSCHVMEFSPDGSSLAGATGKVVQVWAVQPDVALEAPLEQEERVSLRIAYSPDGRLLASAHLDGTIRLLDARTLKLRRKLAGHDHGAYSVAFSPDGTRLVSGGRRMVKVWDVKTGQELLQVQNPAESVRAVAFTKDGKAIATTHGTWDADTGQQRVRFNPPHIEGVFSADGAILATRGAGWELRDAETDSRLDLLKEVGLHGATVAFSPDGRYFATCDGIPVGSRNFRPARKRGPFLRVWNLKENSLVAMFESETGLKDLAFSHDGQTLAIYDGTAVHLWDPLCGQQRAVLDEVKSVQSLAFSPDDTALTAAGDGVKSWPADPQPEAVVLRGHTDGVYTVVFSSNGESLASSDRRMIYLWEVKSAQSVLKTTGKAPACSPDGAILAFLKDEDMIAFHSARTGERLRVIEAPSPVQWSYLTPHTAAFSPDGQWFSAIATDAICIWDCHSGELVRQLDAQGWAGLAFGADRETIITTNRGGMRRWHLGSGEHQSYDLDPNDVSLRFATVLPGSGAVAAFENHVLNVRLWDAATGQERWVAEGFDANTTQLVFSRDGRLFSPLGIENAASIYDSTTGEKLATLIGDASQVTAIAFAPHGKHIAVRHASGVVELWAIGKATLQGRFSGHTDRVLGLCFSPDGKRLASGGADTNVILRRLDDAPPQ